MNMVFRIKKVGRRLEEVRVPLEQSRQLQRTAAALRPTDALVPKGLYRFSSFEEADRWMRETMARTLARRSSRI